MIEGEWVDDPSKVKDEFRDYFASRLCDPGIRHGVINFNFSNRLNIDQSGELEAPISRDEIRRAVWDCGENKSPGPDGFTFEFFRRFWNIVGPDLCLAVEWFFHHASFPVRCNYSFIALIPKILNPKSVGIKIDSSTTLSHLFYEDDAVFIGEWSRGNLTGIIHTLRCFSLLSGLFINLKKSQLLGIGIPDSQVLEAATLIGCSVLHTPFKYLGIMVPKAVLKSMESIRRNFFNGIRDGEKKIAWVSWSKVLASKSNGGLGVSSFYALNRGLLFSGFGAFCLAINRCGPRVGNGMSTSFWHDQWLGDSCLRLSYPLLFALENNKDLNGDGCFCVKDVRRMLDDMLLPKSDVPSRWVKQIPIKVNVLAWKIYMDRLPTRVNLHLRGVHVSHISCPICCEVLENLNHLLFCCDLAKDIARSICNWWGLVWNLIDSYRSWLSWFNLVQLQSSLKQVLEGVFYTSWWSIWSYRNHLLFSDSNPRKDSIFEDIVRRSFS
nr:RNA-directed DNA polymerase, eukaryota [Tanacetum cinerariifolium]